MKWWIYIDGKYLMQDVDLLEKFRKLPASRVMNIIDYIYLNDLLENQKEQEVLHTSRAKLDKIYQNIDELDEIEREPLPEDTVFDVESMDPEYVRKAQETKVNGKTDLKYVQQTDSGFLGLGPAFG